MEVYSRSNGKAGALNGCCIIYSPGSWHWRSKPRQPAGILHSSLQVVRKGLCCHKLRDRVALRSRIGATLTAHAHEALRQMVSTATVTPGMCFDRSCQEAMDTIFLVVVGLPLIALLVSIVWAYRPLELRADPTMGRRVSWLPFPTNHDAVSSPYS